MGVKSEWVKKIEGKPGRNLNYLFLAHFDCDNKIQVSCKTAAPKALREIDADFAICKTEKTDRPSCNLPGSSGRSSVSVTSLIKSNQVKMIVFTENRNVVFSALEIVKNFFALFLTFSFSLFKKVFPGKTVFAHLLEKNNLLVRSDNNTGFSPAKILQTTTI